MININTLNQNNNYSLGKPNITTQFSALELTETISTTGNMGKLIPIGITELQPNQGIVANQSISIQFTPLVTNLMHQVKGEILSYFVPYRLIWNEWEDFITGGKDGLQEPLMPNISLIEILDWNLKNGINESDNENRYNITKAIKKVKELMAQREKEIKTKINSTTGDEQAHWKRIFSNYLVAFRLEQRLEKYFSDGQPYQAIAAIDDATAGIHHEEMLKKALEEMEEGAPYENATMVNLIRELNLLRPIVDVIFTQTLWDYFTLPFDVKTLVLYVFCRSSDCADKFKDYRHELDVKISELPFRAYNKIYNDWVRLADWEDEVIFKQYDMQLMDGNYDWDYFTRARRYQLRGAMPSIPVSTNLKQVFRDQDDRTSEGFELNNGKLRLWGETDEATTVFNSTEKLLQGKEDFSFQFDSLMTAAALMNYFTANARIRPRYAEHLLSRWNVKIQDARLQLAEFVGANTVNITSQGVVQTSAGGEGQTGQGNITGQLWGNGSSMSFKFKAMEHGIIISMLIIKPANSYEVGFNAMLKLRNKFEIPTPEMANLPDVPVMGDELIPSTTDIIGYKAIYDEYRTKVNKVTGLLRPSNPVGLSTYTMARKISKPRIKEIVKCMPKTNRIKQYIDQPDFIMILATSIKTSIPLPYTSDVRLAL